MIRCVSTRERINFQTNMALSLRRGVKALHDIDQTPA